VPVEPSKLLYKVDVVWNLSDPSFSNILESFSIPNIGIPSFSPIFSKSGEMLRKHMKSFGVPMPRSVILPVYQKDFDGPREKYAIKKAKEIFEKFSSPWVVKSFTPDSNMGIHLAKTFGELIDSIEDGIKHEKSILIEEFIAGKVATVHSVPHFRGQDIYTFPLGNSFGSFSPAEKEKIVVVAKNLHDRLGIKHYLKSDFVLNSRGKVYLLNFELTPDLKQDSHFSQVCESVGAKTHQVIDHILEQALS
jgi:D-alanine-D-alanine ligase